MTVYVDDYYIRPDSLIRRVNMSRLVADSEDELHAFALGMGLKRSWVGPESHAGQGWIFYQVDPENRLLAIDRGAQPIIYQRMTELMMRWRQKAIAENKARWDYLSTLKAS